MTAHHGTWCHQHETWECPFIWGLEKPKLPKFCCHRPIGIPHDHGDPPSLSNSVGDLSRFRDAVHLEVLDRIWRSASDAESHDPPSLPSPEDDAPSQAKSAGKVHPNDRRHPFIPWEHDPARCGGEDPVNPGEYCKKRQKGWIHDTSSLSNSAGKPDPYLWPDGSNPAAPGGG